MKLYLSLFCFILLFGGNGNISEWEMTAEEEGIAVYSRLKGTATIKEVKVEMEVEADMEHFLTLLNDVSAYPSWVYKCTVAETIEITSDSSFVYYVESDFPFPVSNRDMVISSQQSYDPIKKEVITHSKSVPDRVEKKKGLVRIQEFESSWRIREIAPEKLEIVYQAKTDPAGYIPTWIINLAIGTGPLKTMKALRELLNE